MAVSKRFIAKNGLDNNSNTITNVADPVNAQDVATKNFSSNASNLSAGTVAPARLGTGTPDNTKYLRGDGSWQVVSSSGTNLDCGVSGTIYAVTDLSIDCGGV